MIAAIHQPQYLPWLGFFDKMARADVFVLLDNVQFKKNEWQNRNRIRTSQGWQWLTVPVLHDFGQTIDQVRINPSVDWRGRHARAIELNYAKAPYFARYWPELREIFEREWPMLGGLNIELVTLLARLLGIRTKIVLSSELPVTSTRTSRLVALCRCLGADTYLAGAGCADYMDADLFRLAGIEVLVQQYKHPVYAQGWAGSEQDFIPCLSVVDLLFNCGDNALEVLTGPRRGCENS